VRKTSCTTRNSVAIEYGARTAVVCHDAGAANIIVAELLATSPTDWRACMRGPAHGLWTTAFPALPIIASIETALEGAALLISGTGWATSTEHDARRLAKESGIYSIAVVDHWVGYAERFERNGQTVLPDEIWVTDDYAFGIATQMFPGTKLSQKPNRYVENQLREIRKTERSSPPELLYVLEPIRADWGGKLAGEFQALDYFVTCLPKLGLQEEAVIRLRPHPSDEPGKYDAWISRHPCLRIHLDSSLSIANSLGRATWVAGCETFALTLGLAAGRTTYCTLPPWAPACRLPHAGLVQLRQLG
jgi:hypothetical protein